MIACSRGGKKRNNPSRICVDSPSVYARGPLLTSPPILWAGSLYPPSPPAANNGRLKIGGYLEVQTPFKFVEQTIYGRSNVLSKLYASIKRDPRHSVTDDFVQVIPYNDGSAMSIYAVNKINGGWGMVFRSRVKGVHYVIFDHLETASLKPLPKGHVGVVTGDGGGVGLGAGIAERQKREFLEGAPVAQSSSS